MNSQLEEITAKFVADVRRLSSFEAVQFDLFIGTNEHTAEFKYKTATHLERDGISMRNLNGQWIRAAEKKELPKTIVQQAKDAEPTEIISLCIGCIKENCSQRSEIDCCPVTICAMRQAK